MVEGKHTGDAPRSESVEATDAAVEVWQRPIDSGASPPQTRHDRHTAIIAICFPYLLILNYVSGLTGDFGAVGRQFAIARTPGMRGRDQPQVALVSAFHRMG